MADCSSETMQNRRWENGGFSAPAEKNEMRIWNSILGKNTFQIKGPVNQET